MAIADRSGLPICVCVESATPHEVTLAISTLLQMTPTALYAELRFCGIEVIAPHREKLGMFGGKMTIRALGGSSFSARSRMIESTSRTKAVRCRLTRRLSMHEDQVPDNLMRGGAFGCDKRGLTSNRNSRLISYEENRLPFIRPLDTFTTVRNAVGG